MYFFKTGNINLTGSNVFKLSGGWGEQGAQLEKSGVLLSLGFWHIIPATELSRSMQFISLIWFQNRIFKHFLKIQACFSPAKTFIARRAFTLSSERNDFGKKSEEAQRKEKRWPTYKVLLPHLLGKFASLHSVPLCSHSGTNKNFPVRQPQSYSHFHAWEPEAWIKGFSWFHVNQNGM